MVVLGAVAVGEWAGLWHFVIRWEPGFLTLVVVGMVADGFLFLLTWRLARRFGWRGLAVLLVIAAVLGPIRDYEYMQIFPEWGAYAPGIAPLLAVSVTYVLLLSTGHAVMRLIAGPAGADRLGRRPWEAAGDDSVVADRATS
jgi:hypothetical protein